MRKIFLQMMAAAIGLASFGAKAADSLTMTDFAHSIKLQVNGYTGSETLTDFPVLVRVSEAGTSGFLYSEMSAKNKSGVALGYDLAFFAEDGVRLASEIDTWDASGTSLVWVRLPQMQNGTRFYMCYNVADGVMVENPNPWGDYVGVWHMRETGVNKDIKDASPNELHGYTTTGGGVSESNGRIGRARTIASDKDHAWGIVVDATTNSAHKAAADSLGTDFSASFWMNPQASDVTYGFLIDRRKGEYNDPGGWGLRLHLSPRLEVYAADEKPDSANYDGTVSGGNYAALFRQNTWSKVDVHWKYATNGNSPVADIYLNGILAETVTLPKAPLQDDANIGIGGSTQLTPGNTTTGKGRRFRGNMDEVRLRAGTVSADWVKAGYDTVNDEGFVTVVPPDVLTVAWANADGAEPGLDEVAHDSVVFAGTVRNLGETAESCAIEGKVWPAGGSEPEDWMSLTNGLVVSDSFEMPVTGLLSSTEYSYRLRAVGNDNAETNSVSGAFTTASGLHVAWSETSGVPGFITVAYDFAKIDGTVTALGGAATCATEGKFWPAGESEPAGWSTLRTGLGLNAGCLHVVTNLTAGTVYSYALRAVGDDGSISEPVTGTFTTRGEAGETIGSPDTHFFTDGTNAYWVVNEFERYLPLTVTGYAGTETLTNFPVLVDVRKSDTNGFTYDDFYRFNGDDIAFVDEKGRVIPHEVDTWNPNGMTLIWVRLPEMNNGTEFTMCYRSPLLNPPSDPGNVFERYVGVWHMNETLNGVVEIKDSTTNNLPGETHANSLAGVNVGQMIGGNCRRVAQQPGTSANYGRIIAFDHDDILRTGVGNVFTYSGWYKLAEIPPKWSYLVSRKSNDQDRGWGIQYDEKWEPKLRVWSGSAEKNKFQLFDVTGASATGWNYWTFVYDGSVNGDGTTNRLFHAYLDGEELASTAGGFLLNYDVANDETADYGNLVIGGQENGTGAFNGWVDEARFSKGARSADWIKAEYDSMRQKDIPFVTKGTQIGRGDDSLVPVVVWETGAGMPETVIDVSYAYVQFAGTVTFCGAGADVCRIEYQLWADGEVVPGKDDWTALLDEAKAGTVFSIPVYGLKQDMPYNFRIRAVNVVNGKAQSTREIAGAFRTNGNINETGTDGELLRVDNKFVHRYPAGEYTFTTPDYVTNIEIMVVGGGGAGGYKVGGGGGGGGLFYSRFFPVETNTTYVINVGQGGVAASNLTERSGNGQISYFALSNNAADPLISVPGGGGGGSFADVQFDDGRFIGEGAPGASGGGGTYARAGGSPVSNEVDGVWVKYGSAGGGGNDSLKGGADKKSAAGGGGGAGRAGLSATFDQWWGGGSGGVGLGCAMTGEMLYYGAGGGGGYMYKESGDSFTKPGAGGSGIGGNAADVRNGIPATSGVENTGAGGGGGSMTNGREGDTTYWRGGNGGDGVVLISYEVHGRDPISEEPRITMTGCTYMEDEGLANIAYRVYWAGVQSDTSDVLVHYSTVGPEELTNNAAGGWVKVDIGKLGVGSAVFVPPEVGYTYWVCLVARKDANSYAYSEEFASFTVPALTLNGATWTESKTSPDEDYATVSYRLYDTNEVSHLYCYWSESQEALEGDGTPSGDNVYLLDLGANTGTNLSGSTSFVLPAAEGLERNRTYYIRLASGDTHGLKRFLSDGIVKLDTAEKPITVLTGAAWSSNNVATVQFKATVGKLDPAEVEVVALCSLVAGDVKGNKPEEKESVSIVSFGVCSELALDEALPTATFPLWSETVTNYYVRLALSTNVIVETDGTVATNRVIVGGSYSAATKELSVFHAIEANTLLYIVTANPKLLCYGDEPLPLDYELKYAGQTEGWGWTSRYGLTGEMACDASSAAASGSYPITQGTFNLVDGGQEKTHIDDDGVERRYQYKLTFSGATYTITNAVFSTAIADVSNTYTAVACDTGDLAKTLSGIRNNQSVAYRYRVGGAGGWSEELPEFVDVGNYNVQFKATAPNHDDVRGSFMVTIAPAPLAATIGDVTMNYTGGVLVPEVATNVTGLVRGDLNRLTCEFRDEASEWTGEVPTFTLPGTYRLYFRVSAPNHTTFMTNCTVTVNGWDFMVNMDGATGYQTPIRMSDPGWLIRNSGKTGEYLSEALQRYGSLDARCPNGLKLWHNYAIGRTNMAKRLVATILQRESHVKENEFLVHFPNVEVLRNTGLAVQYRLDKKLKGESAFTIGVPNDEYEAAIPLGPGDPTGLYVFNIVLSSTNGLYSGEAVLASVATVGVMRVSSAMTNTVIAVPWASMSTDVATNMDVSVSDVVNPNGLSATDTIYSYNRETTNFNAWTQGVDGSWGSVATVTKSGVSESAAAVTTFVPGKAFWLVRSAPGEYIYLIGRYTGEDYVTELEGGTANAPGHTLVANPTFNDIDLNGLAFVDGEGNPAAPAADDRIMVMNAAGLQTIYYRNKANTAWGRNVTQKIKGSNRLVWSEGGTIPAGTGFWYNRTAEGTLRIRFESVK